MEDSPQPIDAKSGKKVMAADLEVSVASDSQSINNAGIVETKSRTTAFKPDGTTGFKKDLNWLGILAAGYNVSSSWLVIVGSLTLSLPFGPYATVWGVVTITPVYLCVGLTLAELISAYPTTGGQYHWTSILAPGRLNKVMSYFVGFTSWFSWLTMSASSAGAIYLCSSAIIYSVHPDYDAKTWHSFLFYEFILLVGLLFNLFGKKIQSVYYSAMFVLSVAALFTFIGTTWALAKTHQSSTVVWTEYTSDSGWSPGVQFFISLASPIIAFCPLDGAVHLVEEVNNARKVVPRTVLTSLAVSFITSFAMVLTSMYCVSDFEDVLETPSGFPLFEIWAQASQNNVVPIVFAGVVLALLPVGTIASIQVGSMMAWSMASDGGLPLPKYLSRVNTTLNAPVWALLLNFCLTFLLGFLYLFSSLAFNSIVGIAAILQQLTLAVPAALLIYRGRSEEALPANRQFRLPNWLGWTSNIVTVAFICATNTFLLLPTTRQPDASTMNYACAVVAGIFFIEVINWFLYARKHYSGPTSLNFES